MNITEPEVDHDHTVRLPHPGVAVTNETPRRYMPPFRVRPYTTPEERAKRPERLSIAGPIGIAAALKAEAQQRHPTKEDLARWSMPIRRAVRREQRRNRRTRMARKQRRGWA